MATAGRERATLAAMAASKIEASGAMPDGDVVHRAELCAASGVRVAVATYGATLTGAWAPDRAGAAADVVLGADSLAAYRNGFPAPGPVIGRVANRIAGARFVLEGREVVLPANDGLHHLHGGPGGFWHRNWAVESLRDEPGRSELRLSLFSDDGDQGYPGAVRMQVLYALGDDGALRIEYEATADRLTPLSPTHHAYFNLSSGAPDVLDHVLWIDADRYTPVGAGLIPTGEVAPVAGTPLDFTTPRRIGDRLAATGLAPPGYDHNLALREGRDPAAPAAWLLDPASGRRVTVTTTEPGIQLYTGNFLTDFTAAHGRRYRRHGGLCLETQHWPDAVHHPAFPSILLRPGVTFRSATTYRFDVA